MPGSYRLTPKSLAAAFPNVDRDNSRPKRRFIGKIGEHDSTGSSIVLDGEPVDVTFDVA
jgi:hypothetical protein